MTADKLIGPESLKVVEKNGERIVIAALYGNNRPSEYLEYHRKVFARFGIPINHVFADFATCHHGSAVDGFLADIDAAYDYFVLFDTDAVPLRPDFINLCYDKIRDKRTVFGAAQQSNHIYVNNTPNHVYVGPCAFAISREMYVGLGRPPFAHTSRSDCAEEITWRAEELGYNVCCVFPSHVYERRWQLGNGHHFGIGTTYGNCVFHAFLQSEEKSKALFVQTCEAILAAKQTATRA